MKKFLKLGAVLTALVLGLACFTACGEENDDGGSSNNGGNVTNNGGNTNNGNTNAEEEKPKRTVVAEWKYEYDATTLLIFYSDMTYECKEKTTVIEKGQYYGASTKEGTLTLLQQESWDNNAKGLLPKQATYHGNIEKQYDDDDYMHLNPFLKLYIKETYKYYYLQN